jgi:hypothetical protein
LLVLHGYTNGTEFQDAAFGSAFLFESPSHGLTLITAALVAYMNLPELENVTRTFRVVDAVRSNIWVCEAGEAIAETNSTPSNDIATLTCNNVPPVDREDWKQRARKPAENLDIDLLAPLALSGYAEAHNRDNKTDILRFQKMIGGRTLQTHFSYLVHAGGGDLAPLTRAAGSKEHLNSAYHLTGDHGLVEELPSLGQSGGPVLDKNCRVHGVIHGGAARAGIFTFIQVALDRKL